MLQQGSPSQSPSTHDLNQSPSRATTATAGQKRKADDQAQNERLSKRLSLLNLGKFLPCIPSDLVKEEALTSSEQNGSKLYVPVENPSSQVRAPSNDPSDPPVQSTNSNGAAADDEPMQLDDTAHKVYIYSIDDELSSSESEPDDGRLVFLPDIEKHLRQNRIPPGILPNSEGELAGMQMVLYSEPKALSVPEEKDGVRRAVVEARRRLRERQNAGETAQATEPGKPNTNDVPMNSNQRQEEDNDADDEAMDMD